MDYKLLISGFFAGSVQTILGHPFDTIKTRLQLDNNNIRTILKNIKKNEKISALYKGGMMPLIGNSILNSFLFTYHYNINKKINNHFLTGISTGIISGIILSPFELIKCNYQNNRTNKKNRMCNIINKIKRKEILIWNGLLLSIMRDSIGLSIYFGIYEEMQKINNNVLINGGIAGCLSWIYSYPIDVIKTKKQISNESIKEIIKNTKKKNYINGMSLIMFRSFIVNAGVFYTYENINKYI